MQYTSSEASKLLKKLMMEHDTLISREDNVTTFGAFANEDVESLRPVYDYAAYQAKIAEVERKIRVVKHAINTFNLQTVLPGTDLTIDQALVYLPQLTARKVKLDHMAARLPKERLSYNRTTTAAVSEFLYANYDVEKAQEDYDATVAEILKIQSALDTINNTVTFDINI